jgi:hypothetical protein
MKGRSLQAPPLSARPALSLGLPGDGVPRQQQGALRVLALDLGLPEALRQVRGWQRFFQLLRPDASTGRFATGTRPSMKF